MVSFSGVLIMVLYSNIENDFFSGLLLYINKENIKMRITKKSKTELNLVSPDYFIIFKLIIDNIHHNILYGVYLELNKKHLKERILNNFEKMYSLQTKYDKWHLPKYLPDVWMKVEEVHIWAKKANFKIKGMKITKL
jgi:hypothetical protein